MTFSEFVQFSAQYAYDHPEQRVGQALFNALYVHRPDMANKIRTTERDPFYNDTRTLATWHWIQENWDV